MNQSVRSARGPKKVSASPSHGKEITRASFGAAAEVVAGTALDVTERTQAEDQLRRNHDIFFALIQNNPFGAFAVDADFRLREVSLGAQKVFENVRPLQGRDFAEVLRTVWPEPFASEAIGRFRHTLDTGEPYSSPSTVEQRADIGQVEAYDWRVERINLPDGTYGVLCYFYDLSERQRWEAILRNSEERLRLATEAAELGIWTWQPNGDVVVWENDRPYEIFALPRTEPPLTAAQFKSHFLHPDDLETFENAFTRTLAKRVPLVCECRICLSDGKTRWLEFTGRTVDAEETVRLIGTVRDISDRKEAEESIRLSEAKQSFTVKLADALRPLSDPVEVQTEASRMLGQRLGANRVAYFELRGEKFAVERDYTDAAPSIAGKYPAAAFGEDLLATYRAGITAVEEDVDNMSSLTPSEKEAYAGLQIRSYIGVPLVKDGVFVAGLAVHAANVRKWTSAEIAMAEDTAERTWAAVERVRAEAAMRASEESRRLALDAAELGTFNIDPTTNALTSDERFRMIFSGTTEAMDYEEAFAAVHPDDRNRIREAVAAAIRIHEPAAYAEEYRVVHPDESVRWVFAKGRAKFEGHGPERRIVSFDGTILDITALKDAEEAMRLSEAKESFTAKLTNTLRPLSDPIEVQAEASRLLGELLAANRVVYFEILDDEFVVERDYFAGVQTLVGQYPVASFGQTLLEKLLNGRTVIEADATTEPDRPPGEQAAFAAIQVRGHVDVPLVKGERFLAGMTVHVSDRRDWTEQEVALIEDTAERTWEAVERVRAENALRQSEERLAFVRQSSGIGFWYCDLPFDILQWDEVVKAHFHLRPDATVTIQTFYDLIHPADRDLTREAIERSIATHSTYNVDYRTVDPDSGAVTWVRAIGRTFYAPDGTPTRFDGVTMDVTELKLREAERAASERELAEERDKLRFMADSMPQMIFTAGPDGSRNYFNRQWLEFSGLSSEQLEGLGWADLVHPDDLGGLLEEWSRSIEAEKELTYEYRLRSRDGAYRWHLSRAYPKRDESGEITLWIGSSTDVDDARRAEELHRERLEREVGIRTEELMRSNEQLQGFTYSVAHDLRQQIRGISVHSTILLRDANDFLNSESKKTLEALVVNAKRLSALVDDLLTYARLGRNDPKRVQLDLSLMAEEVAAYLRESERCQPRTKIILSPCLTTNGDPAMIRLALENLMDNACKYSADAENPIVEIGQDGDYFFVRDNGIGFEMEYVDKLFQPFERLHKDSDYPGTGIGLANVKRIVEKHGGNVKAEGRIDDGAKFSFNFGMKNGVNGVLP